MSSRPVTLFAGIMGAPGIEPGQCPVPISPSAGISFTYKGAGPGYPADFADRTDAERVDWLRCELYNNPQWRDGSVDVVRTIRLNDIAADLGVKLTYLYFMQEEDNGAIKIGVARDVRQRLSSVQCGHPRLLTLLAQRLVLPDEEKRTHLRLEDDRIRGEWFRPSERVLEEVQMATWDGRR